MTVGRVVSLPRSGRRCTRSLRPQARRAAAWEDRDMHVTVTSGLLAAALLWATESIALEPKRPPSLPALDFIPTLGMCDSRGIEPSRFPNHPQNDSRWQTEGGLPWAKRSR